MSTKVLVTGGCGYIGSVLVPILLQRGYQVRVYDKLYFGEESLRSVRRDIELVPGDVRNFDASVLNGIDAVIHLGSLSNDPTAVFYPTTNYSINYEGTINVARACKKKGVTRFTFASGCVVYGFFVDGIADETSPTNPQGDYDKSKLQAEQVLQKMAGKDFCPVILRQGTVFGFSPRMRWDLVVNAFVMQAFKEGKLNVLYGGEAWRPHVHVKDIAEAHIRCIEAEANKVRGQVFNVVHANIQIIDLAQRVQKTLSELGVNVDLHVDRSEKDKRSYQISNQKMTGVVGFTPSITIEEGVREIFQVLNSGQYRDFDHPIYYNLPWMRLLAGVEERIKKTGQIL